MKTTLMCFLLLVLPITILSIPINLEPSRQNDRKESYKTLYTLITKLSSNVEVERNEFLNLAKLEDKTNNDKKLEIENKKLYIEKIIKNYNLANQHYTTLTNEKNQKLNEKNKILNSIKLQQVIIQHELDNVNHFYNESIKFKTYEEYSAINKEIDELKSSISKESSDIQQKYLDMLKKIQHNIDDRESKLLVAKEDVKVINKNVEDSSKNLDELKKQFESFLTKYRINLKNRDVIKKNYADELVMLKNILHLIKNHNLDSDCTKSIVDKSKETTTSSTESKSLSPAPELPKSLSPVPQLILSKEITIFMTCDNEFDLYINGKKIGKGDTWTTTYKFITTIKQGDVIAIDGVDKGGPAAFIGIFGDKLTKANDWRCSTKETAGWTNNNFDDSSWSKATSYGKNTDNNIWKSVGRGQRPNIPAEAEWLWTSDNNNHNRVYCRSTPFHISTQSQISSPKSSQPETSLKVSKDSATIVIKSAPTPKPAAVPKPVPTPKPVPVQKPVPTPKPVPVQKPAPTPKPVPVQKPVPTPKPVPIPKLAPKSTVKKNK